MKKVLFITWDSDQTNYLESLFLPIFEGIQKQGDYKFLIAQFSWASKSEVIRIKNLAMEKNLDYFHLSVNRFPHPFIGTILTTLGGAFKLKNLISREDVKILMPRSTMPALMINRLQSWIKSKNLQVIFDADGFPLQERVDFTGMNSKSLQFRFLKKQETQLLHHANAVLTRSNRAIEIHLQNHPDLKRFRFFKVRNGRDSNFFKVDEEVRIKLRAELKYSDEDQVWVYTGSLGPAYAWNQLIEIFRYFIAQNEPVKLLILTKNLSFLKDRIPGDLLSRIQIHNIDYKKIPDYLNVGDLGISLRTPSPSLSGLFPIKLGEYLLTGLPILASIQVGDTEELIKKREEMIGVDLAKEGFAKNVYQTWKNTGILNRFEIRSWAMNEFSLENSIKDYLIAMEFLEKSACLKA